MDNHDLNKQIILKSMDEDIKRSLMRQIEKCKAESPSIHYQLAHHLLSKYEPVMDIFAAAETSSSEMDEIKRAHSLCSSSIKDGKELVWICYDCKKVIGFFNTLPGLDINLSTKNLTALIDKCPLCESVKYVILKSNFLLSGLTLEKALGLNELEAETDDGALETMHVSTLMTNRGDLKKSIDATVLITGKSVKALLMEGKIQNLSIRDDEGYWWNALGKMTPEDVKKFGLSTESDKIDIPKLKNDAMDFFNKGSFEEANRCFDQILAHEDSPACWTFKGLSLAGLGKYADALMWFDKCLGIDPEDRFILNKKAEILHSKMGKPEEARACFEKVVAIDDKKLATDDKNATTWNNKAFILYNFLHRHEEAIECFKKAAELGSPDAKGALRQLGIQQP